MARDASRRHTQRTRGCVAPAVALAWCLALTLVGVVPITIVVPVSLRARPSSASDSPSQHTREPHLSLLGTGHDARACSLSLARAHASRQRPCRIARSARTHTRGIRVGTRQVVPSGPLPLCCLRPRKIKFRRLIHWMRSPIPTSHRLPDSSQHTPRRAPPSPCARSPFFLSPSLNADHVRCPCLAHTPRVLTEVVTGVPHRARPSFQASRYEIARVRVLRASHRQGTHTRTRTRAQHPMIRKLVMHHAYC